MAPDALAKTGSGRAVDALIAVLQNGGDPYLQSKAVDALLTALEDESSSVRKAAVKALGEAGTRRAVEPLIAALQDKHDPDVRLSAVDALGKIGGERAVDALIAALQEVGDGIKGRAAKALAGIDGSRAAGRLNAAFD